MFDTRLLPGSRHFQPTCKLSLLLYAPSRLTAGVQHFTCSKQKHLFSRSAVCLALSLSMQPWMFVAQPHLSDLSAWRMDGGHTERFVSLGQGGKAEQWLSTLVLLLQMASRTLQPDLISSNTASWHEIVRLMGTLHDMGRIQGAPSVTSGPKCRRLQVEVGCVSFEVDWYPS